MSRADDSAGVSWYDVRTVQHDVECDYQGKTLVLMSLQTPASGPWYHHVTVQWRRRGSGANDPPDLVVSGQYPTVNHKTLPGLLFRLFTEMHRKLEGSAPAEGAQRRLF